MKIEHWADRTLLPHDPFFSSHVLWDSIHLLPSEREEEWFMNTILNSPLLIISSASSLSSAFKTVIPICVKCPSYRSWIDLNLFTTNASFSPEMHSTLSSLSVLRLSCLHSECLIQRACFTSCSLKLILCATSSKLIKRRRTSLTSSLTTPESATTCWGSDVSVSASHSRNSWMASLTAHCWHLKVYEDYVELLCFHHLKSLVTILGDKDLGSGTFPHLSLVLQKNRMHIIDQQHPGLAATFNRCLNVPQRMRKIQTFGSSRLHGRVVRIDTRGVCALRRSWRERFTAGTFGFLVRISH